MARAAQRWATVETRGPRRPAGRRAARRRADARRSPASARRALGDEVVPGVVARAAGPRALVAARHRARRRRGGLPAVVPEPDDGPADGVGRGCPRRWSPCRARAGLPVWIPDDVAGHCCAMPWSSKGFARRPRRDGARAGREPCGAGPATARCRVVIDAASCTHGVLRGSTASTGSRSSTRVAWAPPPAARADRHRAASPRPRVHPTCSTRHLGLAARPRGARRRAGRRGPRPGGRHAAAAWPATAACCTPS